MDSQIAFFCGDSEACLSLGSEEALAQAQRNIQTHYVTVGVLELLEARDNILTSMGTLLEIPCRILPEAKIFRFLEMNQDWKKMSKGEGHQPT